MKKIMLLVILSILTGCYRTIPYTPSETEKIQVEQNIAKRFEQAKQLELAKPEYKHTELANKKYPNTTCKNTVNKYIREHVNCKNYELINITEHYRYAGAIRCDVNIRCNTEEKTLFSVADSTRYGRIIDSYWLFKDEEKDVLSRQAPSWISDCVYVDTIFCDEKCPKDDSFAELKACLNQTYNIDEENAKKDALLNQRLKEIKEQITKEETNTPARVAYEANPEKEINWFATLTAPIWVPLSIPIVLLALIL